MKGEAKVLGPLMMILALGLFVACGENGGTTQPADQGGQPDAKVTDDAGGQAENVTPDSGAIPDQGGEVCVPQCEGKECGPDGCGGVCGTCEQGKTCNESTGKCEACQPNCEGKECGPDGCGGVCGTCEQGKVCNETTGLCEECQPNCEGKECGNDGCGGSCGTCPDERPVCTKEGQCVEQCQLPNTWGPIGVVTKLETPTEKEFVEANCPDFSGDGKGDSALRSYASMINPEIQKAIQEGKMGVLFEFWGLTVDFVGPAVFDLNGLAGEPDPGKENGYLLDPRSYNPETCEPLITFPATLTEGSFRAGPSQFVLDLAALGVEEVPLTLIIGDTTIKGDIVSGGLDGVTVQNGILAGVLTKQLLDQAIAIAEEQCQVNPQDWCSYLSTAKQLLPMLFDLDLDPAIPSKDAMSVCFSFELGPATITGYKSEE